MAKIKQIFSREILNSSGLPTIETTVVLQNGITATASVPSETQRGAYEAAVIRDNDPKHFQGQGVLTSVSMINTLIGPKLVGTEVTKQQEIDKAMIDMDGTQNKARLGANTLLSISTAIAKAGALSTVMPLFLYLRQFLTNKLTPRIPIPLFSLMEGGKQYGSTIDFQELFIIPASSRSFSENLQLGTAIQSALFQLLKTNGFSVLTGATGAFSPQVKSTYDAFSLLEQAIEGTNYRLGFDVFLGFNALAQSFYSNQQYKIHDKQMNLTSKNLLDYYQELLKQFHILYMEDVLGDDDWDNWQEAVRMLGTSAVIAGGNLTATNPYRLQMALAKKALTAIVIRPSQIGTIIESLAVAEVARDSGLKLIVSQRENETLDTFIADFAVSVGADYCQFGPLARGERIAKYNKLLQIEQQLKTVQ